MFNKIKKHTMRITTRLHITVSNKTGTVHINVTLATTAAKGEQ